MIFYDLFFGPIHFSNVFLNNVWILFSFLFGPTDRLTDQPSDQHWNSNVNYSEHLKFGPKLVWFLITLDFNLLSNTYIMYNDKVQM